MVRIVLWKCDQDHQTLVQSTVARRPWRYRSAHVIDSSTGFSARKTVRISWATAGAARATKSRLIASPYLMERHGSRIPKAVTYDVGPIRAYSFGSPTHRVGPSSYSCTRCLRIP